MGGQRFRLRKSGLSMSETYRDACRDAEAVYGHQEGYSGEINSTINFHDVTKDWKASKLTFSAYIDREEGKFKLQKGVAYGICIKEPVKNGNKIKSVVEHNVVKGTTKWLLKYVVTEMGSDREKRFDTKTEAVKYARGITESSSKTTFVHMEKVMEKGNSTVAIIKYKRSGKESAGEYVFFGIAPC